MKNTSKILALVLVLMMAFAVLSALSFTSSAANIPAGTELYLQPNANWKNDSAWFAAYFFGNNGDAWAKATAVGDGTYKVVTPNGNWTNVIFVRMNKGATALSWNSKWDQTVNLTYDGKANLFTVKEGDWNNANGTWSTYGSTCAHTNKGAAATCTTPQVCNDCGDAVVSALGHTYNSAHLCTRCNTQATFTVAGDGPVGGWEPANTANDMTYADGVYTKVYTNVAAGSYKLKVARDHTWDTAYPDADKSYTVAKDGSIVTVTLKGTTVTVDVHAHDYVAVETIAPTYTTEGLATYTCSCGDVLKTEAIPVKEVKMPEAEVTPLEGTDLTFALTFTIKDLEAILADPAYCEALLNKYGKWYVDYRLTISGLADENASVTFNANGEADGYLAGRYNNWEDNIWVNVPDIGDLVIKNGESILVMKRASEMYGISGLRQTFKDIATNVVIFDCGIYFTPEFLHANPDMKVTLELIVFNDAEETLVDDAEFAVTHTVTDATCTAPMVCTCGYTDGVVPGHTFADATCTAPKTCTVCGATEGEALGHNYYYNLCLTCYAPNPEFINNYTTVGENTLVCNKWHLVENEGGHGKPYQFTFMTIPEDGFYIFTTNSNLSVFIYTIPYDASDVEGWATGGPNWAVFTYGQAELKAGTYYLGFIFLDGEGEYDLTITKHDHTEEVVAGKDATCTEAGLTEGKKCSVCGTVLVKQEEIPATGHTFVDGKCECGADEPVVEPPVEEPTEEPKEELNWFQKIIAWFKELINKLLALFKR